jgi:hypothetical protein
MLRQLCVKLSSCQMIKQGETQNIGAATTPPFPAFGQAAVRPVQVRPSASNSSVPILRT